MHKLINSRSLLVMQDISIPLRPRASRIALAWRLAINLLSLGAIGGSGLPGYWQWGLLGTMLCIQLLPASIRRYRPIAGLWLNDDRWLLWDRAGRSCWATLKADPYISRGLVILVFRLQPDSLRSALSGPGRPCSASTSHWLLWSDALDAATWRRLQVRLRLK